ncbi:MAG: alpha/beta hydrolase [Tsuneonella sp.]
MLKKIAIAFVILLASAAIIVTYVTPWPSVMVIRMVFDAGAEKAAAALASKVPTDLEVREGLTYDPADPDARLDIYRGKGSTADGPTIVWFHGGGFVSGRRGDVANYLKILAGQGFTVVNVDYTIAPEATYPTPIRQANTALSYLAANATELGINADRMVLAGDSAGAQIAAQTAAMITNASYADAIGVKAGIGRDRLAGALLHCGVYDVTQMGKGGGIFGWFVKSTVWAYSGERDPTGSPKFATMSVVPYLTPDFPPAFVSAGNADPLGPQSVNLAKALQGHGVATQTLFFPADYKPPLAHEYQFDLDSEAGRLALQRSTDWLRSL